MTKKSCCITGHRAISQNKHDFVEQALQQEIDLALHDGYRMFYTGFAEGTDMLFAKCVLKRREYIPDIFLEAAIPYADRIKQLRADGMELLEACNGVHIICEKYQHNCFFQRNRYMVDKSNRIIAVYDGREIGGTYYTIRYARQMGRELRIISV